MGKGSSKGHTPREAKDNLKSTQLLSVIDAISEGPIEGPVDGLKSVLLNSTPVLDSELACSLTRPNPWPLILLMKAPAVVTGALTVSSWVSVINSD